MKDPICPTCKKPITDEDAVMHHNCLPPDDQEEPTTIITASEVIKRQKEWLTNFSNFFDRLTPEEKIVAFEAIERNTRGLRGIR